MLVRPLLLALTGVAAHRSGPFARKRGASGPTSRAPSPWYMYTGQFVSWCHRADAGVFCLFQSIMSLREGMMDANADDFYFYN